MNIENLMPDDFLPENKKFRQVCDYIFEMELCDRYDFFTCNWIELTRSSSDQFKIDVYMLAMATVDPRQLDLLQKIVKICDMNTRTSEYLRGYREGISPDFQNVSFDEAPLSDAKDRKDNRAIGHMAASEVKVTITRQGRFTKPSIRTHHY
jgi:hypothetical protein